MTYIGIKIGLKVSKRLVVSKSNLIRSHFNTMKRKKLITEILLHSKDEFENINDVICLAMESKKQLTSRLIHINNNIIENKIINNIK